MLPEYKPDALIQLCHVLLPDDASLAADVDQAIQDPDAYCTRFAERLQDDRGFEPEDGPIPDLPWIAMLDGLYFRQRLAEVDWRADSESVMADIDGLLGEPTSAEQRWTWVDTEHRHHVPTGEFLQAVGDQLLQQGRMLAHLYLDSDSYPISIIDPDQFPELRRLAQVSGYGDIQPLTSTIPLEF